MDKFLGVPDMIAEARATRRGHHWALELAIFLAVFFVASMIESLPLMVGMIVSIFNNRELISAVAASGGSASEAIEALQGLGWVDLVSLFSTVLMTVTVILFCRWIEKRRAPTLGFRRGHILREYSVGVVAALAMISAAVGIGIISGAYRFERVEFSVWPMLLFLFGYMLQGMSEETLCRGYLMVSISRRNPVWLGALLSSIVFGALHLMNPGISVLAFINLVLSGAVFAVYVLRRGNIWGACAMHSFWNFFQGNLYGISVSGTGWGQNASVFRAAVQGAELWSGGAFGIEGGLCDTIVEIAALLVLLFLVPKKEDKAAAEAAE